MSDATSSLHSDATGLAVFAASNDLSIIGDLLTRLQRPAVLQAGGPAEAAAWCAQHGAPHTLLVDIGASTQALPDLLELAAQAGPACRIVVLGTRESVDFYRQLLQAGLFDYLLQPLRLDLLADTLTRADDDLPLGHAGTARAGRTIAITGAAGGLGASTLVAALGQWLATSRQTPTVLVDFDRTKSDLPLLLGLEADGGLGHLLEAPAIDPRLLQRTLQAASGDAAQAARQRLHVLSQRPGAHRRADPDRVLELGSALGQFFSMSLWDLPADRPAGATEVLAHAEVRIALTDLTVQSARHTRRLLVDIGDESAGQSLLLVTSGARHGGQAALDVAQFESFVGRRVDAHLPHAGTALATSLLQGQLNAQAAPAYAHAVAALGDRLLGRPTAPVQASGIAQRLRQWLRLTPGGRTAKPA